MQELELLAHAVGQAHSPSGGLPDTVLIPPGDDLAAVRIGEQTVLIGCDQVVESLHYEPGAPPEQVGHKAIARNVSDVAAMAGKPVSCVVSCLLPKACGTDRGKQLIDGLRNAGTRFGCPVVGGDVSLTEDGPEVINVTILGEPAGIEPVCRYGGQPYVTGRLGGSIHGWHLRFEPRIDIARHLASNPALRPNAMMDLSDGLAMDLPRLVQASNCGAEVDLSLIPIGPSVDATLRDAWRHAIGDGEDYELLIASRQELPTEIDDVPLTRIGRLTSPSEGLIWLGHDGRAIDATGLGWQHRV